jgi:hypothetical protein
MQPHTINSTDLDAAIKEINRTFKLPVYEAFDVAWIAVDCAKFRSRSHDAVIRVYDEAVNHFCRTIFPIV